MNCSEAREALLEAEPAELRGGGSTALGRHLTACPDCSALARAILADSLALDTALHHLATAPRPRRAVPRRPLVRWAVAGLAAAAVIATLLLVRRQHEGLPGNAIATATPALPRGIEVDLAATPRQAAVFATADSTITVVWFY